MLSPNKSMHIYHPKQCCDTNVVIKSRQICYTLKRAQDTYQSLPRGSWCVWLQSLLDLCETKRLWKTMGCFGAPKVQAHSFWFHVGKSETEQNQVSLSLANQLGCLGRNKNPKLNCLQDSAYHNALH